MSNPYWYKLIETLKQNGTITNGLTIPYLIGSYRLVDLELSVGVKGVTELLTKLINSETTMKPVLQHCDDIGKYVIGLKTKDFCEQYFSKELSFNNEFGAKTFYVTSNAVAILGNSIDEISVALYEKYKDCIEHENYSWSGSKYVWETFNTKEIAIIKSI